MKHIFMLKYVIHEHRAIKAGLHTDLRIQIPGKTSYASWAIPKVYFPTNYDHKVLAIRTKDHSKAWFYMDNIDIPLGEYGAGKIKIIQKGIATIYGWSDNHITFYIKGAFVTGKFSLIKFKSKRSENVDTWMLIKTRNQEI